LYTDADLARLAARVAVRASAAGRQLATAESCTGGWVAKCLTDVAGSSAWFERGWVTYSNAAKQAELGVSRRLLERHGAVSEPVVREMARGALRRAGADLSVAISGIAGPSGGSPDKPVGTVWFALAVRHGRRVEVLAVRRRFRGDRGTVRARATAFALRWLAQVAR